MVGLHKQDVLWLEISVGEVDPVQVADGVAQLVADVPDLLQGVGPVVVVLLWGEETLLIDQVIDTNGLSVPYREI